MEYASFLQGIKLKDEGELACDIFCPNLVTNWTVTVN